MQHNQEKYEGIYSRLELTGLAGATEEQSYNSAGYSEAEIVPVGDIAMQHTQPIKIVGNLLIPQRPALPTAEQVPDVQQEKRHITWKTVLGTPKVKAVIGLLIGVALLLLVLRFVDIPTTIHVLQDNLATPRGLILGLLTGFTFLLAYAVRGVRWKLFLNSVGQVSTFKAVQLFLVGVFINILLPVQGGEIAKSLMLKRVARIPVNQSLPTIVMDKSLDLMPALFIIVIVPLLGLQMDIWLWLVLGVVGGLFLGLICFIILAAWKRTAAISLLHKMTGMLPKSIASKIRGFAAGFVDSLLLGASRPKIFIPAVLLTCVAVGLDSLYTMLAFLTIGYSIPFRVIIFGYTLFNLSYILPNPPGQVGSVEAISLLVFTGLLHVPRDKVTAMLVFAHPWTALLLCITAMACLSSFGLKVSSAMKMQIEGEEAILAEEQQDI